MGRVVITGIGVNSPIGCSFGETMANIELGSKGLNPIENIDTAFFPTSFSAEVKENGSVVKTSAATDRKALFINRAFEELTGSNDFLKRYQPEDMVINIGSGIDYFDLTSFINSHDYESGKWQNHCSRAIETVRAIAGKYNICGGYYVNVSACVASSQAMGLSFRILQKASNKAIITGGFDSMLSHLHYMGFYKLGALSNYNGLAADACKPFDKRRSGLVIGEGGIAILLETDDSAPKDKILAEIAGYGSTLDAYQITDPEPTGKFLAQAAQKAIDEAGISADSIDCVHMHETGTIKNAIAESKALEVIFGHRLRDIPVYSMKGQIGHLIGACGAMEMLGVIYSLQHQQVPPTVNFEIADPDVPLRVIKDKPLDMKINYILKLNAAFGGQNTALVIKKY